MDEDMLLETWRGIGTGVDTEQGRQYRKGEHCVACLQDLMHFIRRDNPMTNETKKLLGRWKILQNDLIPLIANYHDDDKIVYNACKLVTFLTMPAEVTDDLEFAEILREHRRAFVKDDALGMFAELLAVPFAKDENERTEEDFNFVELLLVLFRNVLSPARDNQPEPELHNQIVQVMHRTQVLEALLVLAQNTESESYRAWGFLLLEIFDLLYKYCTPEMLVEARAKLAAAAPPAPARPGEQPPAPRGLAPCAPHPGRPAAGSSGAQPGAPSGKDLALMLEIEEARARASKTSASARHSRFGGTIAIQHWDGSRHVLGRTALSGPEKTLPARRRAARRPRAKGRAADVVSLAAQAVVSDVQATGALAAFAASFLASGAFNVLQGGLKEDLERESATLTDGDKIRYFTLLATFVGFHARSSPPSKMTAGPVATALDYPSVQLVMKWVRAYNDEKKWVALGAAVGALKELVHALDALWRSGVREQQRHAQAIISNLFYEAEQFDLIASLPKLFDPSKQTRRYLADLVETVHVAIRCISRLSTETGRITLRRRRRLVRRRRPAAPDAAPGPDGEAAAAANAEGPPAGETAAPDGGEEEAGGEQSGGEGQAGASQGRKGRLRRAAADESDEEASADPQGAAPSAAAEAAAPSPARSARAAGGDEENGPAGREEPASPPEAGPEAREAAGGKEAGGDAEADAAAGGGEGFEGPADGDPSTAEAATGEAARGEAGAGEEGAGDGEYEEYEVWEDEEGEEEAAASGAAYREAEVTFLKLLHAFADNRLVRNYGALLGNYAKNGPGVNHALVAMFTRIARDLSLEPALWQLSLLRTYARILRDPLVAADPAFAELADFCRRTVRHLVAATRRNKLLFCEIMFPRSKNENAAIVEMNEAEAPPAPAERRPDAPAGADEEEEAPGGAGGDEGREEEEWVEGGLPAGAPDAEGAPEGKGKKRRRAAKGAEEGRARRWTADEVERLKELFEEYRGGESVLACIAALLEGRSELQVANKLRALKLAYLKPKPAPAVARPRPTTAGPAGREKASGSSSSSSSSSSSESGSESDAGRASAPSRRRTAAGRASAPSQRQSAPAPAPRAPAARPDPAGTLRANEETIRGAARTLAQGAWGRRALRWLAGKLRRAEGEEFAFAEARTVTRLMRLAALLPPRAAEGAAWWQVPAGMTRGDIGRLLELLGVDALPPPEEDEAAGPAPPPEEAGGEGDEEDEEPEEARAPAGGGIERERGGGTGAGPGAGGGPHAAARPPLESSESESEPGAAAEADAEGSEPAAASPAAAARRETGGGRKRRLQRRGGGESDEEGSGADERLSASPSAEKAAGAPRRRRAVVEDDEDGDD
eukprot:tig00001154_g7307.t1